MTSTLFRSSLVLAVCVVGFGACTEPEARAAQDMEPAANEPSPSVTEPATELLVIATGDESPSLLTLDDRYVYWLAGSTLRRAPLEGGTAETLASALSVTALAAANGTLFYTDLRDGTVVRVDQDKSKHVIGRGAQPSSLAVRDDHVFWTNAGTTIGEQADGSIATARTDGSEARVLLEGQSAPAAIAVDGEHIYFSSTAQTCSGQTPPAQPQPGCAGGGVFALARDGGGAILVAAGATPTQLALNTQGVFWVIGGPTRVMSAPLAGKGPAEVRVQSFEETPGPVALDDEALYFSSSQRGRVIRLPFVASTLTPIAVDLGQVGGVAVNARGVYVAATSQGRIVRFPKDGSAARPGAPITGPCPMPLGTAEEIAATPRAEASFEHLALQIERERVVASQETYERVLVDVPAIRALDPTFASFTHLARDDGKTLLLTVDDRTYQSIEAEAYSAWDCLNDFYGLARTHAMTGLGINTVTLELEGKYNLELLKPLYEQLPGVTAVSVNGGGDGDGPTICAKRTGETIDYVFDNRTGDCWSGCFEHKARHFTSTAPGIIEAQETWDSTSGAQTPDWFSQTCPTR